MFERFNGNVVPFADESTSTNRTVFGSETQSDDIDDNLNADFKKGWEIVGLNDNPTREDFNAMGYTLGYLTSYLYQNGVAEYNLLQEYKTNSIAIGTDGNIYQSLVDNNLGNALTDATKWVCIASKNSIVNSIAELKTISNTESINVLGYYEKGDGGGGTFYWDATSTETDNGGTIIQATGVTTGRWKRVFSGSVNVKWFGAKGDGVADDTVALENTILNRNKNNIIIPDGIFLYKRSIKVVPTDDNPLVIIGQSKKATNLYFAPDSYDANNSIAIWIGNHTDNTPSTIYQSRNIKIKNISFTANQHCRIGFRLRECYMAKMENVFIGSYLYNILTTYTALLIDGIINSTFNSIELSPNSGYTDGIPNIVSLKISNSLTLDMSSGSGSGAGSTSSTFNNCYIKLSSDLAQLSELNNVNFNECIFESGGRGIRILGSFMSKFTNCYYENISSNIIYVNGADARLGSSVVIDGGYYQANNKSGYIDTETFIHCNNVGLVKVYNLDIRGNRHITRLVSTSGTKNHSIVLGNPKTVESDYPNFSEVTVTNPFSTAIGSPEVTVTMTSHNFAVGDSVGFKGFTDVINGLYVNLPFCIITSVVDANTFKVKSIYYPQNANATGSSLGGTGKVYKMTSLYFGNNIINTPSSVNLIDCKPISLNFSKNITGGFDNQYMFLNGDGKTDRFITTNWTYIMTAQLQNSLKQTVNGTNYAYIRLNFPSGYAQDYFLANVNGASANNYKSTLVEIGKKVPPNTEIFVKLFLAGGTSGYVYDLVQTMKINMFECNENYALPI